MKDKKKIRILQKNFKKKNPRKRYFFYRPNKNRF